MLINQMIDAADEGYRLLEALNYPIMSPEDAEFIRNKRRQCYLFLWIMSKMPLGRLAASDHAMSAIGEMAVLSEAFDGLIAQGGMSMPNWAALKAHMTEYKKEGSI